MRRFDIGATGAPRARFPRVARAAVPAMLVLGALAPPAAAARGDVVCEQYGTGVVAGRYVVQNDRYGSEDAEQCVTLTSKGFWLSTQTGDNPQTTFPSGYPSMYYGCVWLNCSPGTIFPLRIDTPAFKAITTSVTTRLPTRGRGVYNVAYDVWFDPTPRVNGNPTGAELMVWLAHTGSVQPVGAPVATVELAGATWTVWFGTAATPVVTYVRTEQVDAASFRLRDFVRDGVRRGYLSRSLYVTSVQAGFESWRGGVGLRVKDFRVDTPVTPGT